MTAWVRSSPTRAACSTSTRTTLRTVAVVHPQGRRAVGQRPQAAGQPRPGQGASRCGGCWSRCRSGTSGRPRPGRWRQAIRVARPDRAPATRGGAGRRRGGRPDDRRGRPRLVRRRLAPRSVVERWAAAGVRMEDEADERRPRTLAGADHRGDRHRWRASPATRPREAILLPRRQGRRLGVEEDRLRRRRARAPGTKVDKAVQLGVPILDEAGFTRSARRRARSRRPEQFRQLSVNRTSLVVACAALGRGRPADRWSALAARRPRCWFDARSVADRSRNRGGPAWPSGTDRR